ncbi:MAG: YdcH family protein [Geminicoccaceae bacterium]
MVIDTELDSLKAAHRALDERIKQLVVENVVSPLEIQKLKKQKLALRDRIIRIEASRHPDIIA